MLFYFLELQIHVLALCRNITFTMWKDYIKLEKNDTLNALCKCNYVPFYCTRMLNNAWACFTYFVDI